MSGKLIVAVIGKTNAGKSTLVNAIIGEKVSIISEKKQTTRENILGILNGTDFQIVFVDTPGIHKTKNILDKNMMKQVRIAKEECDLILYVIDSNKNFDQEEYETVSSYANTNKLILVLSKIDIAGFEKVYPLIEKFSRINSILEIMPLSAKNDVNLDKLLNLLKQNLIFCDEEDFDFSRETYTNQSVRFMCEELLREKCLKFLQDEIPHGIFIEIKRFEEKPNIIEIDAEISCQRKNHKSIIIGKQGSMLKKIASASRCEMEVLLDKKVLLNLYVFSRSD